MKQPKEEALQLLAPIIPSGWRTALFCWDVSLVYGENPQHVAVFVACNSCDEMRSNLIPIDEIGWNPSQRFDDYKRSAEILIETIVHEQGCATALRLAAELSARGSLR